MMRNENTLKTKNSTPNRPADDTMSPCGTSGSDIRDSDNQGTALSDHITSTVGSELSESENAFVPKLNIDEEDRHKKKSHSTRFSDNVSNRGVGYGSPISPNDEGSSKLPDVKCKHMFSMKVSSSKKRHKLNTNITNDSDKCMICETMEATAKYPVEANRHLLEMEYPHEFYDRFQRSGKRTKYDVGQNTQDLDRENSEPINICKTVKMAAKLWRREKTIITGLQPGINDSSDSPNTLRDTFRDVHRQLSESVLYPETRFRREGETEFKKEIHLQCKAKNNALVVTDDSNVGQSMVLRGLKGWIMKKDDTCKNKAHKEIKQSLYQVDSLGMNFSIPQYTNTPLMDRKLQSPQPSTCMIPPHPSDGQPIRKSATENINPRNHMTSQTPPRDVQYVPIRGLRRSYTHVPKLFSDVTNEDPFKGFQRNNITTNNDHKLMENSVPFHNGKTTLSLPPIGTEIKSRSLSLSQF